MQARTIRQLLIRIVVGASFTGTLFAASPTVASLSPNSGLHAGGTVVTITGSNFGSTQGSSIVTFNGTVATTISSWSATSIKVAVPSGATNGKVVVTVGGVPSNGVSYTMFAGMKK